MHTQYDLSGISGRRLAPRVLMRGIYTLLILGLIGKIASLIELEWRVQTCLFLAILCTHDSVPRFASGFSSDKRISGHYLFAVWCAVYVLVAALLFSLQPASLTSYWYAVVFACVTIVRELIAKCTHLPNTTYQPLEGTQIPPRTHTLGVLLRSAVTSMLLSLASSWVGDVLTPANAKYVAAIAILAVHVFTWASYRFGMSLSVVYYDIYLVVWFQCLVVVNACVFSPYNTWHVWWLIVLKCVVLLADVTGLMVDVFASVYALCLYEVPVFVVACELSLVLVVGLLQQAMSQCLRVRFQTTDVHSFESRAWAILHIVSLFLCNLAFTNE